MNFKLDKTQNKQGKVKVCGSKSITIRALFCAFLSSKDLIIHTPSNSKDIKAAIDSLNALGGNIVLKNKKIIVSKRQLKEDDVFKINVKSSATLLRFILPVFLFLYPNKTLEIKMNHDLMKRPLDGYEKLFSSCDVLLENKQNILILKGKINGNDIYLDNEKSSQYYSIFILIKQYLNPNINIVTKIDMRENPYVKLTYKVIEQISSLQKNNDINYFVEGDYSNALLYILIALSIKEKMTIYNLYRNSIQGDCNIISYLKEKGAKIVQYDNYIEVYKSNIDSLDIDVEQYIDLSPLLFAFSTTLNNPSTFRNVNRLKYKESNRLLEMLKIFDILNIDYTLTNDTLIINNKKSDVNCVIKCPNDHRIMHALIYLSCVYSDFEICNINSVYKSDKEFYNTLKDVLNFNILSPKILISVNSEKDFSINVDGYVLGYEKFTLFAPRRFTYQEVKEYSKKYNIYVYLNALIHQNKIKEFKKEIIKLAKLDVNFIVQDIGALNLLKEKVSDRRIIFYPYTLICQKDELEAYYSFLNTSIGISNEITIQDTYDVLKSSHAFVTIFGYVPMYQSYRKILSLYETYHKLNLSKKDLYLKEATRNEHSHIVENEYGSIIFRPYILSYLNDYKYLANAEYVFLDKNYIKDSSFKKVVQCYKMLKDEKKEEEEIFKTIDHLKLNIQDGFKYQDSIYKEKKL